MSPTAAFVLGALLGLALGAAVVAGLVRSTGRVTGTTPRGVLRLAVDGLRPGTRTEGIAAQRALARRLKRTGERTASGRRVAASALEVHVSPEDHRLIDDSMGLPAAEADLAEFYRAHAERERWLTDGPARLSIVRDISLRPRQSFVVAETRARIPVPAGPVGGDTGGPAARPPVAARPADDTAVTDVLPFGVDEAGPAITRAYPAGAVDQAAPGDLTVVHGTDVRVIRAAHGLATVGRAAHNDIVIDAPGIARDHLLIEHRPHGWFVVPGSGASAVVLDGRAIEAPEAVDGQGVVELGRGVRLRLSVEAAA